MVGLGYGGQPYHCSLELACRRIGGVGSGSTNLPDTILTVSLIVILASAAVLAVIGPSVFRSRTTPPESTMRRR
jgi:hypothetical protein